MTTSDDKKDDKNQENSGEIIHFPELEKRQKQAREKQKQEAKAMKKQGNLEEEYRRLYRMSRKTNAQDKKPFINWDKIPPFTRATVLVFILVHLVTAFILDETQRFTLYMHMGLLLI